METNQKMNMDLIVNFIDQGIKKLVAERYEILKKDFLEQLEKDKAADLAGISLYIMKQVEINRMGENVIITLRTQNK
jgi:hypothetical protein